MLELPTLAYVDDGSPFDDDCAVVNDSLTTHGDHGSAIYPQSRQFRSTSTRASEIRCYLSQAEKV